MEGDPALQNEFLSALVFLSTPSGWRATKAYKELQDWVNAISIHALRVEGDFGLNVWCEYKEISIHALRVEGDRLVFKLRFCRN